MKVIDVRGRPGARISPAVLSLHLAMFVKVIVQKSNSPCTNILQVFHAQLIFPVQSTYCISNRPN